MNTIDIAILIFLFYHLFRGYRAGFSGSVFLSLRFVGTVGLTWYLISNYERRLIEFVPIRFCLELTRKLLQNFVTPYFYNLLDFDSKALWLIMLIVVSIVLNLAAEILLSDFSGGAKKKLDRNLGFLFGGLKGLCYMMIAVSISEPLIQKFASMEMMDSLSSSDLFRYFYRYNFFMDIFL